MAYSFRACRTRPRQGTQKHLAAEKATAVGNCASETASLAVLRDKVADMPGIPQGPWSGLPEGCGAGGPVFLMRPRAARGRLAERREPASMGRRNSGAMLAAQRIFRKVSGAVPPDARAGLLDAFGQRRTSSSTRAANGAAPSCSAGRAGTESAQGRWKRVNGLRATSRSRSPAGQADSSGGASCAPRIRMSAESLSGIVASGSGASGRRARRRIRPEGAMA